MSQPQPKSVVPLYAGFWRRAAAAMLDSLVLLVPNLVVGLVVPGERLAFLVQLVVNALYFALMHASPSQATLGKRAFGIKVTDLAGNRVSVPRALGRVPAFWLSSIIFGIGLVMAGLTGRKQGLHDMIAGTLVVNREATPEAVAAGGDPMPVTGGVWAMIVVLLVVPFFGILAAIAIPAYQDYTVRAKVADVVNAAMPLRQQVETAHAEKRSWTTGPAAIQSRHAKSAEVTPSGAVVVTLADELATNGRIRFVPTESGGSLRWRCSARGLMPRHLPPACREGAD